MKKGKVFAVLMEIQAPLPGDSVFWSLLWFVPSVSAAPRFVCLHFKQRGNKMAETQSGYLKYLILC